MNVASSRSALLNRVHALARRTTLVVLPLAASASAYAGLTADYSVVGTYSNSGFFTGTMETDATYHAIIDDGFKLSGEKTITDGLFWRYDETYEMTVPGFDTTGIAFLWGGSMEGSTAYDDKLFIDYEFSVEFDHTVAGMYDTPYVSIELRLGYDTNPYTPAPYQSSPWGSYSSTWLDANEAGLHEFEGTLEHYLTDSSSEYPIYWYVQLAVHWNHEFVSSRWWEPGNYASLNGDMMTIIVPDHSIDVTFQPAVQVVVPEPASIAGLGALVGAVYLLLRRRLAARA